MSRVSREELADALELRNHAMRWLEDVAHELPRTRPHFPGDVVHRNRFDGLAFNLGILSSVALSEAVEP